MIDDDAPPLGPWLAADAGRLADAPRDDDFARALLAHAARVEAGAPAAACARLVAWTLGARRGEWHRGLRALDALRRRVPEPADAFRPLLAAREALAAASGVEDEVPALGEPSDLASGPDGPRADPPAPGERPPDDEERAAAWAQAAAMLTLRDDLGRATALFLAALEIVETGVPAHSPAVQALAEAGERLARALEPHARRDHEGAAAMRTAAEAACRCRARRGEDESPARALVERARGLAS